MWPSKQTTEAVSEYFASMVKESIIPHPIPFWTFAILHYVAVLYIAYALLTKPINQEYYLYLLGGILVIVSNYYFHGCILTRIEQKVCNDKSWFGLVTLLKHVGVPISKDHVNFYIKYAVTLVVIGVLIRSILNQKYILFAGLGIFLTPLLFVNSQDLSKPDITIMKLSESLGESNTTTHQSHSGSHTY
jgi:hypothetical protein